MDSETGAIHHVCIDHPVQHKITTEGAFAQDGIMALDKKVKLWM